MATLKDKAVAAVDKAFRKVDSLMMDATFTAKSASDFSLAAGETVEVVNPPVTKRVYRIEKLIRSAEGPVKVEQFLFKSDGKDYTVYDSLIVNSISYRIVTAVDDGFTVTAEVIRV
jgi:hypothetical protein